MNTLLNEMKTAAGAGINFIPAEKAIVRVNALDWEQIGGSLDEQGSAVLQGVLSAEECQAVAALYCEDGFFRSRVVMGPHGSDAASTNTSAIRCPISSRA